MKAQNTAELVENKIIVEERSSMDRLWQKGFGEKKSSHLILDVKEALFLLEKKKIAIKKNGKAISKKKLLAVGTRRESGFYKKFVVFKELREKGFVVKTGFKFGFDFRVYPRGKRPGEAHSQWVIEVKNQEEKMKMPELSRFVRMAQTLHTKALLAIVDAENEINYYELSRLVP
ncbi:tRNA-intron lyase [Candidatus Micrarchaeota archaeon]|nr:tRNA-intron lyase [Candidatus Micrarchaeota archaeon]